MTPTATERLKILQTAAVDATKGYQEALKEAEGRGLADLFEEMARIHREHAEQLLDELRLAGQEIDTSGSIMSTVRDNGYSISFRRA